MLNTYLNAFVTLLVVIDPVAVVPVFIALTSRMTLQERNKVAMRACMISTVLILIFAFGGEWLLKIMGISEAAFQIAGGFLLMIAAVEMVIAHQSGMTTTTDSETVEASRGGDITVFPLAIPLLAGPGALTTVVLVMQEGEESIMHQMILIGIVLIVLCIIYVALRGSLFIQRLLGTTGVNVVTRVFGVILTARSMEFIISGIKRAFF